MTPYTEAEKNEFVLGYLLGRKNGKGGSEPLIPEVEDPDYDWFINSPDPTDNQAVFLVRVTKVLDTFVTLVNPSNEGQQWGVDGYCVDWGDGTVSDFLSIGSYDKHKYETTGDYVVIFNGINSAIGVYSAWLSVRYQKGNLLIIGAKYGKNVYPTSVSHGGVSAFCNNHFLKYVTIKNVDTNSVLIWERCFDNCYSLKKIFWKIKFPYIPKQFFKCCYSLDFSNLDFSQVTEIQENGFSDCYQLLNIDIPKCIIIGDIAFGQCHALNYINAPLCESVIGSSTFNLCTSLSYVNFPNLINFNATFWNCYYLQIINMQNCVNLSENAFYYCYSLKAVDLPLITSIPAGVFNNCPSLTTINAPNCTNIDIDNFEGCYRLRNINVAEGCTFNGNKFEDCPLIYPKPST